MGKVELALIKLTEMDSNMQRLRDDDQASL